MKKSWLKSVHEDTPVLRAQVGITSQFRYRYAFAYEGVEPGVAEIVLAIIDRVECLPGDELHEWRQFSQFSKIRRVQSPKLQEAKLPKKSCFRGVWERQGQPGWEARLSINNRGHFELIEQFGTWHRWRMGGCAVLRSICAGL
eukprot:COSAG01_NODE_31090_length_604_cov_0.699010_1_plen_143_part_00